MCVSKESLGRVSLYNAKYNVALSLDLGFIHMTKIKIININFILDS